MTQPIIDVAGVVFDQDCWEDYLRGFADTAPNYLRMFERRFRAMAGVDRDSYAAATRRGPHELVDLLLASGRFDVDIDAYAASLRAQGVRHQVLLGGAPTKRFSINDRVASFAAAHPDLLQAWAGIDTSEPDGGVGELRRCVGELGMKGAGIVHFLDGTDPLSDRSHELYGAATELGVPLWIHTGHNLSGVKPMDVCTWRHLDAIARAHPDLVLIAGHGGWPWMLEMVALCQRHPNVYLEFSTHLGSQMGVPGSGWEPLLAHGRATIRHKVLFGSVEWAHGLSPRALADQIQALELGPETDARWLHDNAAGLLDLPPAAETTTSERQGASA